MRRRARDYTARPKRTFATLSFVVGSLCSSFPLPSLCRLYDGTSIQRARHSWRNRGRKLRSWLPHRALLPRCPSLDNRGHRQTRCSQKTCCQVFLNPPAFLLPFSDVRPAVNRSTARWCFAALPRLYPFDPSGPLRRAFEQRTCRIAVLFNAQLNSPIAAKGESLHLASQL